MLDKSATVRALVRLALEEDDVANDLTSQILIDENLHATGKFMARERLVACEGGILSIVSDESTYSLQGRSLVPEGEWIEAGVPMYEMSGSYRALLALERTWLNFLQRLCGVATKTKRIVEEIPSIVLYDTRKTVPGWRALDKYAALVGGAKNHRMNLSSMVLVKDNHRELYGGRFPELIEKVITGRPAGVPVEIEVETLDELQVVVQAPVDVIMLDNMNDALLDQAFALIAQSVSKARIEVSGNMTVERMARLAGRTNVCVSMGALTSQATACDISFDILLLA